jgi:hypothetical protein
MHRAIESTTQCQHVIFFSGGICSYLTAKRVATITPADRTILLFCDTRMEDEDLYRFLKEAANKLNLPLIIIADGRTPWKVFKDERLMGNHHADPCSRVLKRRLAQRWIQDHCDLHRTTLYLGLSWYEKQRIPKNRKAWSPWITHYPMCEHPLLDHCDMLAEVATDGIRPPRLYELGFEHNNCGGFCVKAGHAAMRHLLNVLPERYAFHEEEERKLQAYLGKPVTILQNGNHHNRRPISLKEFRERCEASPIPRRNEDWGGCSCMLDPDDDELSTN